MERNNGNVNSTSTDTELFNDENFSWNAAQPFPTRLDAKRLQSCLLECGACLLDVGPETEESSSRPSTGNLDAHIATGYPGIIGLLDSCRHSFHAGCIEKWSKRDTSCPQCKVRFSAYALYTVRGERTHWAECVPTFLTDTLTSSSAEEEDDAESFEDTDNNPGSANGQARLRRTRRHPASHSASTRRYRAMGRAPARRARNRRSRSRSPAREASRLVLGRYDLTAEERARIRLRQEMRRSIELERRRQLCEKVSAEQAKRSIEANFNRLQSFSVAPPLPSGASCSKDSNASETQTLKGTITTDNNQLSQPPPCTQCIPRTTTPLCVPTFTRSVSNFRAPFLKAPPKYDTDFLL